MILGRQAVPFWNSPLSHDTLIFRGGIWWPYFQLPLMPGAYNLAFSKRGLYDTIWDQISVINPPLLCYVLGSHDARRAILYIYTLYIKYIQGSLHMFFLETNNCQTLAGSLKHQVWDFMDGQFKSIGRIIHTHSSVIYDNISIALYNTFLFWKKTRVHPQKLSWNLNMNGRGAAYLKKKHHFQFAPC